MLSKQAYWKAQCSLGSQLIYGFVFLTDEILGLKFFCARVHLAPNPPLPSFTGDSYSKQLFPLAASCGAGFWSYFVILSVAPCLQTPSLHSRLQFTEGFTVLGKIKASSYTGRCFVLPQDLRDTWEKYSWHTVTSILTAFLWLQNATSGWERNGGTCVVTCPCAEYFSGEAWADARGASLCQRAWPNH